MKTPIAVALIVMGGFLVMTPAISDFLFQRNIVSLMSQPGINRVTLEGKMGDAYRFACWLTGSLMIGAAVRYSMIRDRASGQEVVCGKPA